VPAPPVAQPIGPPRVRNSYGKRRACRATWAWAAQQTWRGSRAPTATRAWCQRWPGETGRETRALMQMLGRSWGAWRRRFCTEPAAIPFYAAACTQSGACNLGHTCTLSDTDRARGHTRAIVHSWPSGTRLEPIHRLFEPVESSLFSPLWRKAKSALLCDFSAPRAPQRGRVPDRVPGQCAAHLE